MKRRRWVANLDMYRKIPTDIMEGSRRGSILSYLALTAMAILFGFETKSYLSSRLITDLVLDRSTDPRIRLNFNITMMDLKCDWAVIDVVSVYGTDQNISANVNKWNIDGNGVRANFKGRNRNQKDIDLFDEKVTESLEDLHENGEDAISLDPTSLDSYIKEYDYVFVDFFAPWCSHCRDLAPTWEALAEIMVDAGNLLLGDAEAKNNKKNNSADSDAAPIHPDDYSEEEFQKAKLIQMPVVIAKLDCVKYPRVCNEEQFIRGYPTLRLFADGVDAGDYTGHRNVQAMVDWLSFAEERHKNLLNEDGTAGEKIRTLHTAHEAARERFHKDEKTTEEEMKLNVYKMKTQRKEYEREWNDIEHPGCQLSGHLLLDRAPGNFHVLARSNSHDLAPQMTNVSHQINSLTIGDPTAAKKIQTGEIKVPFEVQSKINPMMGNVYVTENLHESYHHYLKVITTKAEGLFQGRRELRAYQIIPNSQLAYYRTDMVPEAKFSYDLSPIAVNYKTTSRHWYDYITSIMAIIGGVFTVVGMIESSLSATITTIVKSRRKSTANKSKHHQAQQQESRQLHHNQYHGGS